MNSLGRVILSCILPGLLAFAVSLPAFGAQASAQKPVEKVIEGAKREGKVVVYASYTYDEAEAIQGAFRKRYPFITFEHLSLGSSDTVTRTLMESKAGAPSSDVVITGSATALPLIKQGLVREIDWAALGVQPNVIDNPYQVTVATVTYILAWNTSLVPDAAAPKNWEDLLDPKWKGKIGLWVSPLPLADLIPAWGEARLVDYVKKLLQNKPVIIREATEIPSRIGAGEFSVGVVIDQTVRAVAARGAPIKWVWPNPVPVVRYDASIVKSARNPNAAVLYSAWLASPEGAAAYENATGRGNIYVAGSPIAQKTKGKQYSCWPNEQAEGRAAAVRQLTKMMTP